MPYMTGGMAGWMVVLMFLVPLVFTALIVVLIAWVIRSGRGRTGADTPEAPLTILQRRYARGDLGTEEYERMRTTLTKG